MEEGQSTLPATNSVTAVAMPVRRFPRTPPKETSIRLTLNEPKPRQPSRLVLEQPGIPEIVLDTHQVPWAIQVQNMLAHYHLYLDTSEVGTGKTFVALHIAKKFNLQLFVACPPTLTEMWTTESRKYGIKLIDVVSYAVLRGNTNKQPNHPYLTRTDWKTPEGKDKVKFIVTEYFQRLCNNGMLVIFDEVQKLKNSSAQFKACLELARTVHQYPACYLGMLSASPIDKELQILNLLRLIGYVKSSRLFYAPKNGPLELLGMAELIERCAQIDPVKTSTHTTEPLTKASIPKVAFALYLDVLKPRLSGAMDSPSIEFKNDIGSGFYNVATEDQERLRAAVQKLARAVSSASEDDMRRKQFGQITPALREIELAKVPLFIRLIREQLERDPTCKVSMGFNYTEPLLQVAAALKEYKPLIINGGIKSADKGKVIAKYNDDSKARLTLNNISCTNAGISLHDKRGDAPRVAFISPSYNMTDIYQYTGRFYRYGTRSDVCTRLVYGKLDNARESRIISSLILKSLVTMSVIEADKYRNYLLPSEYCEYVEPNEANELPEKAPERREYTGPFQVLIEEVALLFPPPPRIALQEYTKSLRTLLQLRIMNPRDWKRWLTDHRPTNELQAERFYEVLYAGEDLEY